MECKCVIIMFEVTVGGGFAMGCEQSQKSYYSFPVEVTHLYNFLFTRLAAALAATLVRACIQTVGFGCEKTQWV